MSKSEKDENPFSFKSYLTNDKKTATKPPSRGLIVVDDHFGNKPSDDFKQTDIPDIVENQSLHSNPFSFKNFHCRFKEQKIS